MFRRRHVCRSFLAVCQVPMRRIGLLSMTVIALTLVLGSGVVMSQAPAPRSRPPRSLLDGWWHAFNSGALCDECLKSLGAETPWHRGIKGCAFAIQYGLQEGNLDPPQGARYWQLAKDACSCLKDRTLSSAPTGSTTGRRGGLISGENIDTCWQHMKNAQGFMKAGLDYRLKQDQAAQAKQQQAMNEARKQAEDAQGQAQKEWGAGTRCSDDIQENRVWTTATWKQEFKRQSLVLLQQWQAEPTGCGMSITATNDGHVTGSNPYSIQGYQYQCDQKFAKFILSYVLPNMHMPPYPRGESNPGPFDWKFTVTPGQQQQ